MRLGNCNIDHFSPGTLGGGDQRGAAGRNGCSVGVARTGSHRPALPQALLYHHADPGQSGGPPDEKGSLSLSHQNWRLRAGDRYGGAGRIGAEWGWRAPGSRRPTSSRTLPCHHANPGQPRGFWRERLSVTFVSIRSEVNVIFI